MKRLSLVVAIIALSGCYTPASIMNRAIDKTVDSAANKVGERVGEAIAADILANNPHLLQAYAMGVFNVMFYQGGYYLDAGQYRVGEWSTWNSTGTKEADWYEKTLLRRHENGNEWWRVETQSTDNDGKKQVVIMEALFSAPEATGARRVLRMRAQLPGETEGSEIPITEQNRSSWYMSSQKLTKESLDGMTVGEENIEVPAGTFLAKHLSTKGVDKTKQDWWINDAVPGQLVKFTRTQPDSDELYYQVQLINFGSDHKDSKLGIDLDKQLEEAPAEPAADAPADAAAPAESSDTAE